MRSQQEEKQDQDSLTRVFFVFSPLCRNCPWAAGSRCLSEKGRWRWWQTKAGSCPATGQKRKTSFHSPVLLQKTTRWRRGGRAWTAGSVWSPTVWRLAEEILPKDMTTADAGAWADRRAPLPIRASIHSVMTKLELEWTAGWAWTVSSVHRQRTWTNRTALLQRPRSSSVTIAARAHRLCWNRYSVTPFWLKQCQATGLQLKCASAQERASAHGAKNRPSTEKGSSELRTLIMDCAAASRTLLTLAKQWHF